MAKVKDVVCGMTVDSETAQHKSEYKGKTYYFCSPGCKGSFDKNPEAYLKSEAGDQGGHTHHARRGSRRL